MTTPEYLQRLNPSKITAHPCLNCLIETEERIAAADFDCVSASDKIWYLTYQAETKELERILRKYHPQRIIEIGSGSGRIIRTVLDTLPQAEVIGLEKDQRIFRFVAERFSSNPAVRIEPTAIADYHFAGRDYDLALCLMNTFGNINDPEIFKTIMAHSNYFVFSVYNREFDVQRESIYRARGHVNFSFIPGRYCFQDDWVKGLISRSYTETEIKDLIIKSDSKLIELKATELLYFVVLKREKNSNKNFILLDMLV